MKPRHLTATLLAFSLIVVACDDGTVELSTTSSLVTGTTESPDQLASTTTLAEGDGGETTGTSLVGESVGSFEIIVADLWR